MFSVRAVVMAAPLPPWLAPSFPPPGAWSVETTSPAALAQLPPPALEAIVPAFEPSAPRPAPAVHMQVCSPADLAELPRMAFGFTTRALLDGTKTVTRRQPRGRGHLAAGSYVLACRRTVNLTFAGDLAPFGPLAVLRVLDVRTERLSDVTDPEVALEGFPDRDAAWFVRFFTSRMRCAPDTAVLRIKFEVAEQLATLDRRKAPATPMLPFADSVEDNWEDPA